MSYNNGNTQNARRNRNRMVMWFNPPYGQNVKANIDKTVHQACEETLPP